MREPNVIFHATTYNYEFYHCEHEWILSRWNHHPNFETTHRRCLHCRIEEEV